MDSVLNDTPSSEQCVRRHASLKFFLCYCRTVKTKYWVLYLKINFDTKSLFVHVIIRPTFAKSAFSFGSALDVLKINVSISDDLWRIKIKEYTCSVYSMETEAKFCATNVATLLSIRLTFQLPCWQCWQYSLSWAEIWGKKRLSGGRWAKNDGC